MKKPTKKTTSKPGSKTSNFEDKGEKEVSKKKNFDDDDDDFDMSFDDIDNFDSLDDDEDDYDY